MMNFEQNEQIKAGLCIFKDLEKQMRIQNTITCIKELKDQGVLSKDGYIQAMWNLLEDTGTERIFHVRKA